MKRRHVVFVGVLVVLTVANFLWPQAPSPLTSSSFGKSGSGHGAAYDLLTELELARGRSFESGRRFRDEGTVWWIDPVGVCDGRIARSGEADVLDDQDVRWPVSSWIEDGGVAVVFLQSATAGGPLLPPQDALVACDAIAGVRLPRRIRLGDPDPAEETGGFTLEGALLAAPRVLAQPRIYAFEESLDWEVVARFRGEDAPGSPFVLSRALGGGRLVVVADSGFAHNGWLDQGDAAPLLVDLAVRLGAPRFDEREHGFVPETSAFRYITGSPALPVYAGLLVLGLLFVWRGNALPSRSVEEFDPATPTLDDYVASMSALYARTRDHARVFERYRELAASQLRRHFGLPHDVSARSLVERIEADPRRAPAAGQQGRHEGLKVLVEPRAVANAAELATATQELDELVKEVTR